MKIGILGGGQLGRMFIQNALNYDDEFHVLDPNSDCSCAYISHFSQGNFNDYEDVLESRVWATVINALPPLEKVIREELEELYTHHE